MPKYELVITNDNELSPLKSTPLTLSVLELIGPQGIQGPEGPRGVIGVTDNGGDGSLEYDPTTGIFTYTGPSAAEVRDHFSNGTGVTITDGQISIGQSVATNDDVIFNNVTSDLTGNADTADALTFIVRNSTGATLTEGTAVYVSGIQGNTPEVSPARADSSATMPAFGLVQEDIAASGNGVVTTFGSLRGLDVANFGETGVTFSLGDTVYVSATEAGKLTNVAPAGESSLIQNIGKIERSSPTTNMTIKVGGAGRTNATPNLDDGKIFIGNNSNQSVTSDLNSEVRSRVSATGDLGYDQNTGVFSFTERTAAGILTDLKTVDGATSGLDADLLDGQHGSYYLDWTNTNNKPDPTITLSGDLSGSVTLTDLASGTLEATIAADSVALGTDTTGNYVADVDGTANQIAVSYNPSEGGTPTIGLATNVTTPGNLTVSGDLTVNGTNTIVDSTTVAVADSLFKLAKDNTADSLDAGWYGVYNDGTEKYAGIARDASAGGKFILYDGLEVEPTTTVDTSGTGFNKATLVADIEGDVTGDVTGSVTVGATKTLDVSAGTLTLADNQISGDKINGGTIDSVAIASADIDGGNIDGTVIGATTPAAISGTIGQFDTSLNVDGNITLSGTVDGRTIATDGTKLDTIETNADVTDTANVTAAGALMDSEVTNLAQVKAFDSADYATAAQGATADTAVQPNDSPTFGTITADGLNLGDNEKIQLGASNDLQLFHQASNSFIRNEGTGHIYIENFDDDSDIIIRTDNGSGGVIAYVRADGSTGEAQLYHYGSEKLATKSSGVDVTGTVTADTFSFANWTVTESGGSLYFATGGNNKMKLDANGNLQVVGNVESNATIS